MSTDNIKILLTVIAAAVTTYCSGCAGRVPITEENSEGEWRFAYYNETSSENTRTLRPPVWDIVEFITPGRVRLVNTIFNLEFVNPCSIEDGLAIWDDENSINHAARFYYQKRDKNLILVEGNTEWVYYRPEVFMIPTNVAGIWINGTNKVETMTLTTNGLYRTKNSRLSGYFRIWTSRKFGPTLTAVFGYGTEKYFVKAWKYTRQGDELILIPIEKNSLVKRNKAVWKYTGEPPEEIPPKPVTRGKGQ